MNFQDFVTKFDKDISNVVSTKPIDWYLTISDGVVDSYHIREYDIYDNFREIIANPLIGVGHQAFIILITKTEDGIRFSLNKKDNTCTKNNGLLILLNVLLSEDDNKPQETYEYIINTIKKVLLNA